MSFEATKEETWFSEEILPELLKNPRFIPNLNDETKSDFKVTALKVKLIGCEEAFMLTICYRVHIAYELLGEAGSRSLVVKKTPPVPPEIFQAVGFEQLFSNETKTYEEILPALEKYAHTEISCPHYYYARLEPNFCVMVLEDFATNGWRVTKDQYNISLEHIYVGVKFLAKFHGIGFALRHDQPELFSEVTSLLREARYVSSVLPEEMLLMLKAGVERIEKATESHEHSVDEEFLSKLGQLLRDQFRYGKQRVAPVEPLVTLCHGDFLRNNLAYKYEDANADEPTDILMFDLQTMRISSPMIDLSIFLNLSTFAETRHTHFAEIFSTYCEELAATFHGLTKTDVPGFLSHDSLLKEYVRFLPYSVAITAMFLRDLVTPRKENVLQVERTPEEIVRDSLERGGEVVDREIASQVRELYDLSRNVDIWEGFEWCFEEEDNNQ